MNNYFMPQQQFSIYSILGFLTRKFRTEKLLRNYTFVAHLKRILVYWAIFFIFLSYVCTMAISIVIASWWFEAHKLKVH